MIPKLDNLLERWSLSPLESGMFFWIGGGLAWLQHIGGWTPLWQWYNSLQAEQIALLIFLWGILVAVSGSVLRYIDVFVLRLLEGYYWPSWILGYWIKLQNKWWDDKQSRLQILEDKTYKRDRAQQDFQNLSRKEYDEYVTLDQELMYLPKTLDRLPTRLGNLLRAHEQRPKTKYGLNVEVCWSRLWLVLPEEVKKELSHARHTLDKVIHIYIWSVLFMIWGLWVWWAILTALLFILISYRWLLHSAKIYGQLIEATFDIYRHLLYQALRLPVPENSTEEHKQGKQLTEYLWRGPLSETTFIK